MNAAKFSFTDRQTYLDFVANWKAEYKDLSEKIRITKQEVKDANRKNDPQLYKLQWNVRKMKDTATQMIEDRHAAKALSVVMRDEARAKVAVV